MEWSKCWIGGVSLKWFNMDLGACSVSYLYFFLTHLALASRRAAAKGVTAARSSSGLLASNSKQLENLRPTRLIGKAWTGRVRASRHRAKCKDAQVLQSLE